MVSFWLAYGLSVARDASAKYPDKRVGIASSRKLP